MGSWPYHEDKHGNMVRCHSNPCRLHGGSEIMAESPEDAAEQWDRRITLERHAVIDGDARSLGELGRMARDAASRGGYLSLDPLSSTGDMINGMEPLPVVDVIPSSQPGVPPVFEVSDKYAGRYADMLSAMHGSGSEGAQVDVESPSAMRGMRMFVTPDGLAGAALKHDDMDAPGESTYVTAVVKSSTGSWRHSALGTVGACVRNGGSRLDCFDTFLPKIYGKAGFKPVARIPFDREYAPDGWDYDWASDFAVDGCPDVVFMVRDDSPHDVVDMESYDDAYVYASSITR